MTVQIQRGLEIVPGYTLVRRVGSGMAGEVWVARASGGVHVAIKVIRDMDMVGSKRELGALRIVREVKHTNLCPLIGVWFFDARGELLSNAATDEILGQESSLIDTNFLSTQDPLSGELRDTPSMRPWPNREEHGDRQERGEEKFDAHSTMGPDVDNLTGSGLEETADTENLRAIRRPGDLKPSEEEDDREESSLGEARQMVVAMGLGDRTLFDRLVEMRAPANQPSEPDPMHLPGGIHAKELIRYIAGAASAIDELNLKHNIYHCDIKPQNILIVGGNAQVCDFGLARRVHENRRTQLAIGTPAYGAPEMLFDQTYTKTIDQYSLAITYYELRTGKLPFETTRRSTFLRAKAEGELLLTSLPAAEQAVIAKASDLDPDQRYATCTEFAETLAEAIDAKPIARNSSHHRRILAATLLGIVALMAATLALRSQFAERDGFANNHPAKDPPTVSEDSLELREFDEDVTRDDVTVVVPDAQPDAIVDVEPPIMVPVSQEVPATSTSQPTSPPSPTLDELIVEAKHQATMLVERYRELAATSDEENRLSTSARTELQGWLDRLAQQRELTSLPDESHYDPLDTLPPGLSVTGWDLIDQTLRIPATFIAGVLVWDSGRNADALKLWYSIQNEKDLFDLIEPNLRGEVVDRVLPKLIQITGVDDSDTAQHRYARSTTSYQGVLNLLADFSTDLPESKRRVDRQRFLLSAAREDTQYGLQVWRSLGLDEEETAPQLGFALASLVDVRLGQSPPTEERGTLITERIEAFGIQFPSKSRDASSPSADQELNFEFLKTMIEFPEDDLPNVPPSLTNPTVEGFCFRYAESLIRLPAAEGQDDFLARLENIEQAAGIVLKLSSEPKRLESMRLIATESFLQSWHEQNEDIPPARLVRRLRAYGETGENKSAADFFIDARVADRQGVVDRDESKILSSYELARQAYARVIDDAAAPADLRGSSLRCRAALLTRIAAVKDDDSVGSLLNQAAADAEQSLSLPTRWHLDNDDRLLTAAEVNLSMVRLNDSMPIQRKQDLLEDADQYLAQSIAEREQRGFPSYPQATARLNGYLLDLIDLPPGPRRDQKSVAARRWMQATATAPVDPPVGDITRTIKSSSSRLRCHWHSMCSMVLIELKATSSALAQVQYAYQIGKKELEVTDDRRHLATLILVKLKSQPLYQSLASGKTPDPKLIDELVGLLNTIESPRPDYRTKKEQFLTGLMDMPR